MIECSEPLNRFYKTAIRIEVLTSCYNIYREPCKLAQTNKAFTCLSKDNKVLIYYNHGIGRKLWKIFDSLPAMDFFRNLDQLTVTEQLSSILGYSDLSQACCIGYAFCVIHFHIYLNRKHCGTWQLCSQKGWCKTSSFISQEIKRKWWLGT